MTSTTTAVGVDLAKRVCQRHGVEGKTGEIKELKLTRAKFLDHFAHRAPCLIAMEKGRIIGVVSFRLWGTRSSGCPPRRAAVLWWI